MPRTRAQENRAIRKEGLREVLSKQKHIEQVIKNIKKMEELTLSQTEVINGEHQDAHFLLNKLKVANEQRLRLISKYLPDLKSVAPGVEFEFPKEAKPHEQAMSVMSAMANGLIPPDIGSMFINSIKYMIDIEEYTELKERIASIEESLNIPSE